MNDGVFVRFDHPPNAPAATGEQAEGEELRPPGSRPAAASRNASALQPVRAPVTRLTRFPVGPQSRAFLARFHPEATAADWSDWRWQMRNRIRTLARLEQVFALSDDERAAAQAHTGPLPVSITSTAGW